VTVFDILVELNLAAIIVIARAVLPDIPMAILSPLAVESVSALDLHSTDIWECPFDETQEGDGHSFSLVNLRLRVSYR